ncbi:succinate dehydrogenase [Malaciobacter mytili LMG 24559]|uniref:Succinate dehydrogenase n=1 Tax=Malaciobacter mytili LMG 24559 TaxID=1032238 RepID=A0AAX2AIB7_9BACT|nr:FAD-dependent oxidoreductase [Malaciobacter mytili]AXH13689.1 succinate dehydrogenase, flavoprotein subunit [Malaciobacter mytili LMG 24559]RXK16300.1 succinate dehydrogenase [Malaciobacter mytili LMG 24559]
MTDILIIGSGGAGLTVALEAKKQGLKVKVLSKNYPTFSQTCQAQGGINAILKEEESIKEFIEDTYSSSKKLANFENIKYLCENSKESILWLSSLGVPFSIDEEGNIAQRKFGGTTKKRTCYSSDYTGLKIIHTLYDTAIKENIEFLNEYLLLNLIVENKKVIGITALNIQTSEVIQEYAKCVVLATGGYAGLYTNFTTNSYSSTGDGLSAAIRAGAKLSNIEFVQFHPTALKGANILISESARGEGGYLVDNENKRFVDELKTRDEVARAIYEKVQNDEEVFLDLRHLDEKVLNEVIPQEKRVAKEFLNIDIKKELLPISPAAHYSMGGILTNSKGETTLSNLFACGECAQSGIHGANRLGGNSLLELITFGRKVAKNAIETALKEETKEYKTSKQYLNDKAFIKEVYNFPNRINFYDRKEFMGKILFKNVGIFRTDLNMKAVLSSLRQWQKEFNFMGIMDKSTYYNKNLVEFIEFGNMLELAEVLVVSAISRCESRGSHYRIDYPTQNNYFEKNSIAYKIDGILAVDFEEVK